MEKRKNNNSLDNNQLLLIGFIALVVIGATGFVGAMIEFVIGIVVGIFGAVIGIVGAIIGLVFGLIGAVIGIVGAIIGIVLGTAVIWIPLLAIVAISKAVSNENQDKPKRKHPIV